MKKLFTTILALLLAFGTFTLPSIETDLTLSDFTITASAEAYEGFKYSILDDGTVEITGYTGSDSKLVIPGTIDGKKVTSIGYWAFNYSTNLKSITIPNSVTSIGDWAFSYCTSLTSITIPNSVTSIGSDAFNYCTSLTSITIPNSVTSIGRGAFEYCESLTSITIPNSVTSIGYYAFSDCTSLTSITIPDSVTSIGGYAFYGTPWLKAQQEKNPLVIVNGILIDGTAASGNVVIPNSVTCIGESAFEYCSSLTSITIPNSVTSIGESAFYNCTSLKSITIPNSVTSIGEHAFSNCTNLTSITIPNSVTSIGDWAFEDCTSLTDVYYTGSVAEWNKINIDRYNSCLTDATIHYNYVTVKTYRDFEYSILDDGTVKITDYTGSDSKLVIPSTIDGKKVTSIGGYAFEYCTSLTSITIPNSVTSIGDWAFDECASLTSITIPDSVTSIGDSAFEYCKSLTSITIPNSVTSIGDTAFYNCISLTSITIPNSVTSIGHAAFGYCTSLTSITIPNSVTSIGYDAFYDTPWLKAQQEKNPLVIVNGILIDGTAASGNVVIPNSVTSIGDYAFSDCTSLTSITIPNSVTYIGKWAFEDCTSLTSITIPNSVTSIGDWAFEDCTSLTSITIPNSVTSIGYEAFYDTPWLTDVYYTGSETEWNNIDIGENNTYLTNATIHYNYGSIHTHSYTSKITKAATCTTAGTVKYTCSCGDFYTETIPATGHKSSGWIVDKAASIGVKGSKHKECTICKKILETAEIPALSRISISKASVTLSTSTYAYDGKAKKPGVTVKLNGKTLKNGTDYSVTYSNNTKVGTAKVTIKGKGNYSGSVSKTYSIKNNFKKATVSGISTKAFTGKNITQSITVKYNGKTLKNGTDYTVSYSNNKKVGKATVKITGKGKYGGVITKAFKINPAKQEIQKLTAKSKAFFVDWAQKGSATGYEIQYATNSKFTSAKKVTITNNKTDKTTVSKLSGKKKYYVRVRSYTTVKGTKYYGAWSASKSVTTKK